MRSHPLFEKRPRRRARPAFTLALLWLGCLSTSTCGGRGFFTFPLEGAGDTWQAGTAPTALNVSALSKVAINQQVVFKQQGIDVLDVHKLKPRQVGLLMEAPTLSPNFSFVRQVSVVARAQGLPDIVIATGENLAGGTNYVGLNVADVDLTRYARTGPMQFAGIVTDADAPSTDTTVRLVVDMEAWVAQPGAACGQ